MSVFGQRGDELAAEVGDVGDDAAPDEVRSGRMRPAQVIAGLRIVRSLLTGVDAGMVARGG